MGLGLSVGAGVGVLSVGVGGSGGEGWHECAICTMVNPGEFLNHVSTVPYTFPRINVVNQIFKANFHMRHLH